MGGTQRIALLGFLPWQDPARDLVVIENPAELTARVVTTALADRGFSAEFVPVAVSGAGIVEAMNRVRAMAADLVVALGRTSTAPRVERWGRVPGAWAPARDGEPSPWLLAPDSDALAAHLDRFSDPDADTGAFVSSDDAGAYFCDHLCVELARDARARGTRARFLHVTGIEGITRAKREARLRQYARQTAATVDWLLEVLRS